MNPKPDKSRDVAAYFGFLKEPFTKAIAAKSLFLSTQLQALFTRLKALLARRGMALIIPQSGTPVNPPPSAVSPRPWRKPNTTGFTSTIPPWACAAFGTASPRNWVSTPASSNGSSCRR